MKETVKDIVNRRSVNKYKKEQITDEELMQVLLSSQRYFHQTILLVTHDLELAHTAERIITLDDGRICADLHGGQL